MKATGESSAFTWPPIEFRLLLSTERFVRTGDGAYKSFKPMSNCGRGMPFTCCDCEGWWCGRRCCCCCCARGWLRVLLTAKPLRRYCCWRCNSSSRKYSASFSVAILLLPSLRSPAICSAGCWPTTCSCRGGCCGIRTLLLLLSPPLSPTLPAAFELKPVVDIHIATVAFDIRSNASRHASAGGHLSTISVSTEVAARMVKSTSSSDCSQLALDPIRGEKAKAKIRR